MKRITDPEQMHLYLSDESRRAGKAQSVCFPADTRELQQLLLADRCSPITLQGGRTGVTAGAVPDGGLVINLSAMNQVLTLPEADADGTAVVQPGILLCRLQELLARQNQFFPPDPTETTATLGGMVSCNSSGARSFRYGSTRDHIRRLEMVLSDGDTLSIRRGQYHAKAGHFSVTTGSGRIISGTLPQIHMPEVRKHTAGYFIRSDMDMLDLFIGSEGTLGIVTEIELNVLPQPAYLWSTIAFFEEENSALRFVRMLRGDCSDSGLGEAVLPSESGQPLRQSGLPLQPEAIEFFGADTLNMLRAAQREGSILIDLPAIPAGCAIYAEFASDTRKALEPLCRALGQQIQEAGSDPGRAWFAFRGPDMQRLKDFRHAAPVCVNEQISAIRKQHPGITKLGTDMSVPDCCLEKVFEMYRADLAREGFCSSLFGHIGNNHLHCNIIPRSEEEYQRGKQLYERWAEEVVRMGGTVSAEHGIGKLKPWLLRKLYTGDELQAMLELKRLFDPEMRLNPGNIFGNFSG